MTMTARPPNVLRDELLTVSIANAHTELTRGQWGATIGALTRALGSPENRYLVCAWLFSFDKLAPLHSQDLDSGRRYALYAWVGLFQDEFMKWVPDGRFVLEAQLVLTQAIKEYNALKQSERAGLPEPPEVLQTVVDLGGVITAQCDEKGGPRPGVQVAAHKPRRLLAFLDDLDDLESCKC